MTTASHRGHAAQYYGHKPAREVKAIVTVQVVKTYRLRSYLRMAYPAAMDTRPALSHEVWEQTPPKAHAYMRALEARVAT